MTPLDLSFASFRVWIFVGPLTLSQESLARNNNQHTSNTSSKKARYLNLKHSATMGQGVLVEDDGSGGKVIINKNPATGEVISRVPCTSPSEVDDMIEKAVAAKASWSMMEASERIRLLKEGLAKLSKDILEIPPLITKEMGKPIGDAEEEVTDGLDKEDLLNLLEESLKPKKHGSCVVVRQAVGVVAVLSPWNFPMDEILLFLLPALGSGNTGECRVWGIY